MRRSRTGRLVLGACLALLALGVPHAARAGASPWPLTIRVETRLGASGATPSFRSVVGLDAALDLVADLRTRWPERPIVLDLAPGIHRLAHALRIGPEHSGPSMASLTIKGAPGHRSRIVGSVALQPTSVFLDPVLAARLPAEARGHVRAYRLPEAALTSPRIQWPKLLRSRPDALGLSVFDAEGTLRPATWPNEGWGTVAAGSNDAAQSRFVPDTDRIARWRDEPDLWAEGYWRWDWLFESLPVSGVDVADKRIGLPDLPYEGIRAGARFRIAHALSELDAPGEWWRDRADGLLLAWPRAQPETLEVAVADTLLDLRDANHVSIENLAFEQSRGDLLVVRGGNDIVVRGSRFARAGSRGAVFVGASNSGLDDCDIEDVGRVGVRLEGGNRTALTPGGLFLRDSRLTGWALRSRTQTPAVEIDGVGVVASGNTIHDGIDAAFHIHGNDQRILDNEIARVVLGSTDNGAIYAGRDWTARGTLIEGNFLHDIRAQAGTEVKGVYLDDEASGFTVRHNLFLRVDQAVFIGGGRDNVVDGNLFVASDPAIHVDSRGRLWAAGAIRDPGSELRLAYAAMPVGARLWRERYPGLADILHDSPEVAKGNRLERNTFVLGRDIHVDEGGRVSEQMILDNVGPGGIALGIGDLAALSVDGVDPLSFESLVGPDGAPAAPFDLRRMRRFLIAKPSLASKRP